MENGRIGQMSTKMRCSRSILSILKMTPEYIALFHKKQGKTGEAISNRSPKLRIKHTSGFFEAPESFYEKLIDPRAVSGGNY